jgi:hypothetical protein
MTIHTASNACLTVTSRSVRGHCNDGQTGGINFVAYLSRYFDSGLRRQALEMAENLSEC